MRESFDVHIVIMIVTRRINHETGQHEQGNHRERRHHETSCSAEEKVLTQSPQRHEANERYADDYNETI